MCPFGDPDGIYRIIWSFKLHILLSVCPPIVFQYLKLITTLQTFIIVGVQATWSLLVLITYLVWPGTLIFLGVGFILPKLYVNCLLVMLNYRKDHRPRTNSGCSEPKALRFAPNNSGTDIDEVNINVSMDSVQPLDHAENASVRV
ncbi:hypothetical protein EDD85DRAFT_958625 [Armillaria nabsnona]|nr:hypothetical protein EDD85DRAFT_958625 [Armillaria nabsnona]